MTSPVLHPAFAALLPQKETPILAQLIERAIEAQNNARTHLARIDLGEWTDADDAWQRLLDASADEARQRLLDLLLNEHGVTSALAARIGEVL